MFLKNKNIIFKIRRSKVTDYAALTSVLSKGVIFALGLFLTWTEIIPLKITCTGKIFLKITCNGKIYMHTVKPVLSGHSKRTQKSPLKYLHQM